MATQLWDSYRTLEFTTRYNSGMSCVGKAKTNNWKRCRWATPEGNFDEIRSILNEMERSPPHQAYEKLPWLATLALCQDFHQHQRPEVVAQWRDALDDAVRHFELQSRPLVHENQRTAELTHELEAARTQVAQLTTQLSGADDNLRSTRDHLHQIRGAIEEQKGAFLKELADGERVLESLQAELYEAQQTNEDLKSSLTDDVAHAQAALEQIEAELAAARQSNDESMKSLEAELSSSKDTVQRLQQDLTQSQAATQQVESALTAEISSLKTVLQASQASSTARQRAHERDTGVLQSELLHAQEALQEVLQEAQLDRSQSLDRERKRERETSAEIQRLLGRIRTLEAQVSASSRNTFGGRLKSFSKRVGSGMARVSCWSRRESGKEMEGLLT